MITSPRDSRSAGADACVTKKLPFTVAPSALVDIRLRDLLEALRLEARRGAVDDDVETAELGHRAGNERAGVVGPREVTVAAPRREHLPPLVAQPFRDRGTELAGAPGDKSAASARLLEPCCHLVPVDDVPPGREVVGPPVLVVEVVGVLPNVDAEDRRLALGEWASPGSPSTARPTSRRRRRPTSSRCRTA